MTTRYLGRLFSLQNIYLKCNWISTVRTYSLILMWRYSRFQIHFNMSIMQCIAQV